MRFRKRSKIVQKHRFPLGEPYVTESSFEYVSSGSGRRDVNVVSSTLTSRLPEPLFTYLKRRLCDVGGAPPGEIDVGSRCENVKRQVRKRVPRDAFWYQR